MAKKKIVHLTQATGGVKTYVAQVLEHANLQDFEFVIVAPADGYFEEFCKQRSVRYYIADFERGINPISAFKAVLNVIGIIKKEKPDLVHAHSAKAGFIGRIAARLTGTKLVYTPHAFSYLSFTGYKRIFFYWLEYVVRKYTTLLLAIAHTEANCAIYQLGYPKGKVKVILNAIGTDKNNQQNYNYQVKRIRMIGRLTIQKNPLQFLEIARRLLVRYPYLQFSILGAGIHDDLKSVISDYIDEFALGGNVTIEKWGDSATSEHFLESTDIYVSTSIFEGLPFSLLDAMLYGIPCVASAVDGNIDVIKNGENGFLCTTVEDFCEKIIMLIEKWAVREAIGKNARAYILAHHNIKTTINEIEETYLGICSADEPDLNRLKKTAEAIGTSSVHYS